MSYRDHRKTVIDFCLDHDIPDESINTLLESLDMRPYTQRLWEVRVLLNGNKSEEKEVMRVKTHGYGPDEAMTITCEWLENNDVMNRFLQYYPHDDTFCLLNHEDEGKCLFSWHCSVKEEQ